MRSMVCWNEKLWGFGGARREVMVRNLATGLRERERERCRLVRSSEVLSQQEDRRNMPSVG